MKKLLCIFLIMLLLTGCGGPAPAESSIPEPTETEPPIPWIEERGTPWDEEGVLRELPLTIPDGMHYTSIRAFDGDLLLWSVDNHLENVSTLELCLVELDDGTVSAQKEITFSDWMAPQLLGDQMYLCDPQSGTILQLDKQLNVVKTWTIDPVDASLTMGADEMLYIYDWYGTVEVLDLKTGERRPLMADMPYIEYFDIHGNTAIIEYFDPESGAQMRAALDLITGEIVECPIQWRFTSVSYQDGTWLCENYDDGTTAYVGTNPSDFTQAFLSNGTIRLISGDTFLYTNDDGCSISLHDTSGKALASAVVCSRPYAYNAFLLIESELYGGYFVMISDYDTSYRLLYWDTAASTGGEDIVFEPVPEPGEMEAAVHQHAQELSNQYGLNILVGNDCDSYFYDFDAEFVTDWMEVSAALKTLENALDDYPEGFFQQLRYGDIHSIDINLMGTLTATNSEYTDTYEAFVQDGFDRHVMVVDIYLADESTYYHEFSHIIDSFLEWDRWNREDALFSDDAWCALNPSWFYGYTYSYSWEQYVEDYSAFVDSYSTINPTEDRARVLEYAMVDYGGYTFQDADVLLSKLDYYCRCIRDAFDTTGWPETVLWEQYLP